MEGCLLCEELNVGSAGEYFIAILLQSFLFFFFVRLFLVKLSCQTDL